MSITIRGATAFVLSAILLVSCGGGSTTPPTETKTISKLAGDNQNATVGTAVAIKPSVKIVDQNNAAVSGVSVTFAVASGGGSITGGSATTGSDGVATVGSWTLGPAAGANTLTASASGVTGSPVTFTATGTAPVATAMTKQGGDAQSAAVSTAVTTAPSVKLVDISGNPVSGVAVTFAVASGGGSITGGGATTNSLGIAAVGSWTLGATAGANTLTATATGSGITGNPATFTATGTAAAFSPTTNVSISGNLSYGSINIPAGVTVTLTGDATITVSGAVTIAGTIVGDCKNLSIIATGVLNSSGNINNGCSTTPATAPAMTIVAQGGYHLTGGTVTLGGSLNLTNDATLTDGTFPAPPAPTTRTNAAALHQAGVCSVASGFIAVPVTAKAGVAGTPNGTKGDDGATWVLQCTGELDINGLVSVIGQNGGAGGAGTHTSTTAANSTGGAGGLGGTIKVRANGGDLVFANAGNNVVSGNGGAGGSASASGTGAGAPGASATAAGGAGGAPGNIVLQAVTGGITIGTGPLGLVVGSGGDGGAATAVGGLGQTAAPCPVGAGGAATATGGAGGSTPDKTLKATGAVGGIGNVNVTGGSPGAGGKGTATGGSGGGGAQACPTGGAGGAAAATGGQGGNALLKNAAGALFANGGAGGAMEDLVGKGGLGWFDCLTPTGVPGGTGGAGGAAGGRNGAGGTGLATGAPGAALFTVVSNGGNGGDGTGPGAGGASGAFTATVNGVASTVTGPSFTAGLPGTACVPISIKYTSIPNNAGVVAAGVHPNVQTLDANAVVNGSITITTVNNTFVGLSGIQRAGTAPGASHKYDLGPSFMVNGFQYMPKSVNVCVLNSTGLNAQNPVTITQQDVNGVILQTDLLVAELCQVILINQVARFFIISSLATIDHYTMWNGRY